MIETSPGPFHRDPAARLLVAAAPGNGLTVVTADKRILHYPDVRTQDARRWRFRARIRTAKGARITFLTIAADDQPGRSRPSRRMSCSRSQTPSSRSTASAGSASVSDSTGTGQEPSLESLLRLGLSRREAEVLGWVAAGKTDDEVGTILGLSPRTVHHHVEHVYRKLGVENRTAAARIAIEAREGGPSPGGRLR